MFSKWLLGHPKINWWCWDVTQWRERSYTQPIHSFIRRSRRRVERTGSSLSFIFDITVVSQSITVSTLSIHHAHQLQAMQTFPSALTGRAHWQSWLMMHVWLYSAPDLPSPRHSTLLDHASCFSSVTPLLWIIPPQFFPGPSHICPVLWWRKCILRSIQENRLSSWYRLGRSQKTLQDCPVSISDFTIPLQGTRSILVAMTLKWLSD